ncbi:hypothetical protein BCR34DRAFT_582036 [Clohesyomyces aquaticus]|uniref:BRCT domain-containing protein n=1 Tax=Clohesyomyces aquaticus TaxID=1231657 RepID=A0A1Y2ABG0_9PLEO|nr:hypothetical protein BCR34DRAFT_582036 [Clohesyomyces aquaticus]
MASEVVHEPKTSTQARKPLSTTHPHFLPASIPAPPTSRSPAATAIFSHQQPLLAPSHTNSHLHSRCDCPRPLATMVTTRGQRGKAAETPATDTDADTANMLKAPPKRGRGKAAPKDNVPQPAAKPIKGATGTRGKAAVPPVEPEAPEPAKRTTRGRKATTKPAAVSEQVQPLKKTTRSTKTAAKTVAEKPVEEPEVVELPKRSTRARKRVAEEEPAEPAQKKKKATSASKKPTKSIPIVTNGTAAKKPGRPARGRKAVEQPQPEPKAEPKPSMLPIPSPVKDQPQPAENIAQPSPLKAPPVKFSTHLQSAVKAKDTAAHQLSPLKAAPVKFSMMSPRKTINEIQPFGATLPSASKPKDLSIKNVDDPFAASASPLKAPPVKPKNASPLKAPPVKPKSVSPLKALFNGLNNGLNGLVSFARSPNASPKAAAPLKIKTAYPFAEYPNYPDTPEPNPFTEHPKMMTPAPASVAPLVAPTENDTPEPNPFTKHPEMMTPAPGPVANPFTKHPQIMTPAPASVAPFVAPAENDQAQDTTPIVSSFAVHPDTGKIPVHAEATPVYAEASSIFVKTAPMHAEANIESLAVNLRLLEQFPHIGYVPSTPSVTSTPTFKSASPERNPAVELAPSELAPAVDSDPMAEENSSIWVPTPVQRAPVFSYPALPPEVKSSLRSPQKQDTKTPKKAVTWMSSPHTENPHPEDETTVLLATMPLFGTVFLVDVFGGGSAGIAGSYAFTTLLEDLGAQVVPRWNMSSNPDVTHVVYKDGSAETREKVKASNGAIKVVNTGYVIDCNKTGKRLNETPYLVSEVYAQTTTPSKPLATLDPNSPAHSSGKSSSKMSFTYTPARTPSKYLATASPFETPRGQTTPGSANSLETSMIRWAQDRAETLKEIQEKENAGLFAAPKTCPPKAFTASVSKFGDITPFPAKMRNLKRKSVAPEPTAKRAKFE